MDHILVVDDDFGFRKLLETILTGEGYVVSTAGTVAGAQRLLEERKFRLVLTDLKLPDGDGMDILRSVTDTPVVMVTAFGTVSTAVEAMKLGAVDYLGKPLSSPDELRILVRRTLENASTQVERDVLRERETGQFCCDDLVGEDPRMQSVMQLMKKVAPTAATVLLTGESGTGKEIAARCIHANSTRATRVFVPVNCAALSPTLVESELFGHEKGAFTGAVSQHAGRFERAHGGTLFLDEIGELDGNLQAKLLRVLQDGTFERVGGKRQITVDTRVIAATNRDLKEMVAAGRFREDLYYRINRFPIHLPPLRERGDDIVRLAHYFLHRACQTLSKQLLKLTPEAESVLRAYEWPGNVREMENLMERMAILLDDVVEADDLPITPTGPARPVLFKDIERKAIVDALEAHGGNRTRAARQLGISLRTFQYRLKEYGINP